MTEPTGKGERESLKRAGLKSCRECKELIRKDVTRCPHCGAKQKSGPGRGITAIAVFLSFVGLGIFGVLVIGVLCSWPESNHDRTQSPSYSPPSSALKQERILRERMLYLADIPEVEWYEVEGNSVYIGFNPLPNDWRIIINGAALGGNKAIDFGCHVWAVDAKHRGWRPGDGPFYGERTARYGRLEK